MALTVLSIFVWLVLYIAFFKGPLRLFLLAALGPPIAGVWLSIIEASYKEYVDVVRGAIDVGRFELLTTLRQPLPPTLESERRLWSQLAELALLSRTDRADRALVYMATSSTTAVKT
jgi:hypothetical protein